MFEMPEIRFVLRYRSAKKTEHVALYVGVRILVDRQAARRMLNEKQARAFGQSRGPDRLGRIRGNVDHFLAGLA